MKIFITSLKNVSSKDYFSDINPDYTISIVDPNVDNPFVRSDDKLLFKFHDICFEPQSEIDKSRYIPPTRKDVLDIINFGKENFNTNSVLLCHCMAGISRSSAAALISIIPLYGVNEAIETIKRLELSNYEFLQKKCFYPNNLMIRHADQILSLDGRLESLVEKTFEY
jgi:predicted protein tyrosine phosphatase